ASCAFETRGASDGVIGEDAAVAPAADTEAVGISVALLDGFVDAGEQVFDFMMTPVGEDSLRIVASAAPASPRSGVGHGESPNRAELALKGEAVRVLSVGSSVNT